VALAPWEYLFVAFNAVNFPDLFLPLLIVSVILLVGQVVLYNVRVRQLHRHEPLVTLNEWLLWTGVIVFLLLIIEAVFVWYFIFVLATILVGMVVFVWVRFFRFPPMIAEYNDYLRRTRFFSQEKYKHPEATIRSRRRRRRRA
jgi:phosphatidylserine synthase